ncbi:MAG: tetratricopeptide repeat protein, partial [Polyangiales bacterium]
WGPGGIGKTSLATSTTHRLRDVMDAVLFVPLSLARDATDVERTLAQSLSVSAPRTRSRDDVGRRVGHALASHGRVLVVFDDVERVVAAAAEQVVALRGYAPMAQFLVTSRQPLGIGDEVLVEVPPLGLPLPGHDAEDADAVRLLLARARAVRPDFSAPEGTLRSLARRTEGIPLAIELCAARLDVLSAEQLDERLSRSRDVLRSPRRDVDERHRTLSAAIDVSYQMLDDDERLALSQLSLVRGELDMDGAEAIIATRRSGLDVLQALVRASLVARRVRDDRVTFTIFESVRDHAAAALPPDEEAAARHARHFVDRGARAAADVDGSTGARSLAVLARMHDDLVAVVRRGGGGAAEALCALLPLYSVRGPIASFVELATTVDAELPRVRSALGLALFATGQLDDARGVLTTAIEHAEGDDERGLLLCRLGDVVHEQGDHPAATELHRRALAIAETRGDDALAGICHAGIGTTAHVLGELPAARIHYERALELVRHAGHARGEARTLSKIGFLAVDEGNTAEARDHFE